LSINFAKKINIIHLRLVLQRDDSRVIQNFRALPEYHSSREFSLLGRLCLFEEIRDFWINKCYREYLLKSWNSKPDFPTISLSFYCRAISRLFNFATTRYASAAEKKTSTATTRDKSSESFPPSRAIVRSFSSMFAPRRRAPRRRLYPHDGDRRLCHCSCHSYSFHFLDRPSWVHCNFSRLAGGG